MLNFLFNEDTNSWIDFVTILSIGMELIYFTNIFIYLQNKKAVDTTTAKIRNFIKDRSIYLFSYYNGTLWNCIFIDLTK